jgi:anti-sigma B factor antagonist
MDINVRVVSLGSATNASLNATIVELIGEVSYNTAPAVEAQVLPLAQPQAKLVLDMTQVSYMSSAGLRMLLALYRQVTANQGQIVLVGLIEEIQDAMSVTGFLDFFTSCDTLDAGLSALQTMSTTQVTA